MLLVVDVLLLPMVRVLYGCVLYVLCCCGCVLLCFDYAFVREVCVFCVCVLNLLCCSIVVVL